VEQIHAETCKFNIYVWVRVDFNGLNISRSKCKVMVKFICDISTSRRERNMKIAILMFGFMGIPAGYSFSR
jgi:hypothetical protein